MDKKRNARYHSLLKKSLTHKLTIKQLAKTGGKLMRKAKLHPHYFGDNSHYMNALYLIFFSLNLPMEFKNETYLNRPLNEKETKNILNLFERRIAEKIPVEYITNEAFYLDYTFYVNQHVLIPRSLMNTRFKDFLDIISWKNYRVLDLCTGSGCIGISLALLNPQIKVDLADISEAALKVANINIERHGLQHRVRTLQSDLFENIQDKYDLIISNPPYVSTKHYRKAPREFKIEPELALVAGKQGMDIVTKILSNAKNHLTDQGILIAEVSVPTAKIIKKRYPHIAFKWFNYRKEREEPSLWKKFIGWIGHPDSVFLCHRAKL